MNTLINKLREVIRKEVITLNKPILNYIEENNNTGYKSTSKVFPNTVSTSVIIRYEFYNKNGELVIRIVLTYSECEFSVDNWIKDNMSSKTLAFIFSLKAFIENLIEEFENK